MTKILLLGQNTEEHKRLAQELGRQEYELVLREDVETALALIELEPPAAVLVNFALPVLTPGGLRDLLQACSGHRRIPALALLAADQLSHHDLSIGFDDFQLYPIRAQELSVRIQQALRRAGKLPRDSQDIIQCGDLVVDTTRYEVFVASHPVELTYKEYELLRFLASNPDKVFTREVLLNRVWGYDYYGGARTVDVHIRRLRSKIEDVDHLFIETVRNVGYRFRPSGTEG